MPKTTQEILDHAEELARRFEQFDPDTSEGLTTEERAIRQAAIQRAIAERDVLAAVVAARKQRVSWADIGRLLGTSGEAARQRYGPSNRAS